MDRKAFKDDLFQLGSAMVRLNSIEHLRAQNSCRGMSREEVVLALAAYRKEPHGVARLAAERLGRSGKCDDDARTLLQLIYHGQLYGLGTSPQVPSLADLLWHAGAFILEDNGVSHPNDLPARSQ